MVASTKRETMETAGEELVRRYHFVFAKHLRRLRQV